MPDRPNAGEDMAKRPVYPENQQRKEFSKPNAEGTSEYTDGTTRPVFKKRIKKTSAKRGERAQLQCVVSGSPLPKILWLKNNRPLKTSDGCEVKVEEDGTNTLIIPSASDDDVGIYTARAMNVNGSIMSSADFTLTDGAGAAEQPVLESPMDMDFTTPAYFFEMSSCQVSEGRLARFDCRVVAYPRPEIVWMRDGKVLEAQDRFRLLNFNNEIYSLLIQDVTLEDTGRYTCWARNKFGEAMTEAYLNVIGLTQEKDDGDVAPKFLTRFYDQQTTEGTGTSFQCMITGRPQPSVTWVLDEKEVDEGRNSRMKNREGVVSLDLTKLKVEQSGLYTCQLSNPLGDAICSARLTVLEDKLRGKMLPKFLKKFDHINAKEGEEAKFTSVIVGEPKPQVTWLFDHKPISDSNRRFVQRKDGDSYTLVLRNVRFDDTGRVTCKAVNEEGEVYCSANLHVRESRFGADTPERTESDAKFGYVPTFTRRLHDVEVKEGTGATFECNVMGIPEPEIAWMKDGRVVTRGGRYHMTSEGGTCKLVIDNVSPQDAGVYTCIISNAQGKSSSTAALKLKTEAPKEKTPERRPKLDLEERTSRKDRYSPEKRRGRDEELGARPKRPLTTKTETDRYEDDSKKALELPEMRVPPRLPTQKPIVTDLGEETVRLAWKPAESYTSKRAPPVSYRLEAKELPGKDWMPMSSRLRDTTHYLSDLPSDRDFMIRVRAENDYGISEPTESLWLPRATAFPGVPVGRPQIVDVEDTRAKLSWNRVDIPSFGTRDSHLIYMLEVEEPPTRDWRTIARDLDNTEYVVEGLKPGKEYKFRVRAKTMTGIVSEPSPAASLYTTLARSRAPVDRLEVLKYEPDDRSVQLAWHRMHIPPYAADEEPLMYMIEHQELPLPDWKPLVTGIPTTRYRVRNLDAERDYNFRIRALTPYGISPPSPALPVNLRQTPSAVMPLPEAVIISEVQPESVRLTWRRPMHDLGQPISYRVEMLEPPFSDWRPIATRVAETTYKVTGLRPTKDYQFRVIPQVDSGYLPATPSAALTTLPVRPRLPLTEPKLRELSPESVQLSWRPAEYPAYQRTHTPIYYRVEMCDMPGNTWIPVARRLPDCSYNVTGLSPDRAYKFRIVAETDSGYSEPSLPCVLNRMPVPVFSTNEPYITNITQNVVHLGWQAATTPDPTSQVSYMVEVQSPPGIALWSTLQSHHPTPNIRLADLRPDLDYLVRVRAQCGSYTSEPTLPVYIPRRAAPPRMPLEEPYAVDIGSDYIKLQWRSAELPPHILDYAPITYKIEAQDQPGGSWATIAHGIPHTDFKVTGLNPQKAYSFRVRAENDYGLSDATRAMNVQKRSVPPFLPPEQPLMFDLGPGSTRLSWRPATLPSYVPATSPITYAIYIQELPFKSWRPLVRGIPHTTYHITGLNPDKEYMFRIQAENQYGNSPPSESVHLPKLADMLRPISVPEVSDFDEARTSLKLRWKPTPSPHFDTTKHGKYTVETWEPHRHEWKPVAAGIRDTSYQITELPRLPENVFRVRMDTDLPTLSQPSLPVSFSRHSAMMPLFRPQLYELDNDTVRLSWQPIHLPEGVSRRSVRYTVEQRELPEMRWLPVNMDLTETNTKLRGLRPKSDYEFRVKPVIDGKSQEPSLPVSLFRRAVVPKIKFETPEVYDVNDTSLSLRWNTVDVPAFGHDDNPLVFVIERQTLPGYDWQPIATNITDRRYTVTDLQPYQDYNFRVRGICPSGFTEPSPYVPVYRRPSEFNMLGVDDRSRIRMSELPSQKHVLDQSLMIKTLQASVPSTYIRKPRAMSPPMDRRYSSPNIFAASAQQSAAEAAAAYRKGSVTDPRFKREQAYVYSRGRSPMKKSEQFKLPQLPEDIKVVKPDRSNDLYEWYLRQRRNSDVGLADLRRVRSPGAAQEFESRGRRYDLINESTMYRRPSLSPIPQRQPLSVPMEGTNKNPSVADRYEDIKTPYITGQWAFPRRHSIAIDQDAYVKIQRLQHQVKTAQQANLEKRRMSRADIDLIPRSPEDYFAGQSFLIEDEVNFRGMRPVISGNASKHRSMSQEWNPGYFIVDKFTVSLAGTKKPKPRFTTVEVPYTPPQQPSRARATSADIPHPRPTPRTDISHSRTTPRTRSMTPDLHSRGYTPDFSDMRRSLHTRSTSVLNDLESSKQRRPSYSKIARDMSPRTEPASYASALEVPFRRRATSLSRDYVKPRSYSISGPSYDRKFNKTVEDSKTMINKYAHTTQRTAERLTQSREQSIARATSMAPTSKYRSMSVADIRSDSRYSSTPRGSTASTRPPLPDVKSDSRFTTHTRRSVSTSSSDVKSDPRYTTMTRSSISTTHSEIKSDPRYSTTHRGSGASARPSIGDLKSDSRYTTQVRGSLSTVPEKAKRGSLADTNDDLKAKLAALTQKLAMDKSKKSVRPVMKFKSSRGEGYIVENK